MANFLLKIVTLFFFLLTSVNSEIIKKLIIDKWSYIPKVSNLK